MTNVLLIGFAPDTIPGFEPGAVAASLDEGSRRFAELGLTEDQCLIDFGDLEGAHATIVEHLGKKQYDCVVVGGGIRKSALELFQAVVNLVHWHQPRAAIAFNGGPADSADWALKAIEQYTHNIG